MPSPPSPPPSTVGPLVTPVSASQSSTFDRPYRASKAIDADELNSVAVTDRENSPWITVEVPANTPISDVVLRTYGGADDLNGPFRVFAGTSAGDTSSSTAVPCGAEVTPGGSKGPFTVSCGGVTGKQYVTIQRSTEGWLRLTDVKIYTVGASDPSPPSPPPPSPPSPPPSPSPPPFAVGPLVTPVSASQSSTFDRPYRASKAIDADELNSVAVTDREDSPWITVEVPANTTISDVVLRTYGGADNVN